MYFLFVDFQMKLMLAKLYCNCMVHSLMLFYDRHCFYSYLNDMVIIYNKGHNEKEQWLEDGWMDVYYITWKIIIWALFSLMKLAA